MAFIRTLLELARWDKRIHLVVGDLGFGVVDPFAKEFPQRFINVGVAEQNMTSIAAGMALCGKMVFTYSIGNFPTLRCLEQIRNDICHHHANVKIVSTGGGFAYGALGASHHATEDIAVMRALPQMVVVAPGDPVEAQCATRALIARDGPAYLRLGRSGEPNVHETPVDFRIGKAIKVAEGSDLTLVTTGAMLHIAVDVAASLTVNGIRSRVLSMHTIKPLDTEAIVAAAKETSAIFTLEEHSIIGGLGSAVAEVLAENCERHVLFKRLGIGPMFSPMAGSQEFLRESCSLSVKGVVQTLSTSLGMSLSC
ncbi:MAG TPA: transketolase C-terminal domain-containing protein [Candidatus Acidoferrales bacterium]|nr:transketolase C-terminal domain-containing protein [Candidatus Acidoferrales bacterium]